MGFSTMADRMLRPPSLSRDQNWPRVNKRQHARVGGFILEGSLDVYEVYYTHHVNESRKIIWPPSSESTSCSQWLFYRHRDISDIESLKLWKGHVTVCDSILFLLTNQLLSTASDAFQFWSLYLSVSYSYTESRTLLLMGWVVVSSVWMLVALHWLPCASVSVRTA